MLPNAPKRSNTKRLESSDLARVEDEHRRALREAEDAADGCADAARERLAKKPDTRRANR